MMHTWSSYSWWGSPMGSASPFFGIGFGLAAFALTAFVVLLVCMIALKGYALWHAAKRDEKWWFVILLIVNTAGILELVYLLGVAKVWPKKDKSATIAANGQQNDNGQKAA